MIFPNLCWFSIVPKIMIERNFSYKQNTIKNMLCLTLTLFSNILQFYNNLLFPIISFEIIFDSNNQLLTNSQIAARAKRPDPCCFGGRLLEVFQKHGEVHPTGVGYPVQHEVDEECHQHYAPAPPTVGCTHVSVTLIKGRRRGLLCL